MPRPVRGAFRWRSLVSLLCGIALATVLSTASWIALGHGPARAQQTVSLEIPSGTAAQLAAGGVGAPLAGSYRLSDGDRLRVQNDDTVVHQVDGVAVEPGSSVELTLQQPGRQRFVCTFHASGALDLYVRPNESPLTIVWPSLLLGVPLGLAIAVSAAVFRGLDTH